MVKNPVKKLMQIAMSQYPKIDHTQANCIILLARPLLPEFRDKWVADCIKQNKIIFK